jgi:putative hydrolase of HD superfamily
MSLKRDIELLFEISAFRHLDRMWKQFLNPDVANNAEHIFRVAWIALTLARLEKIKNHEKVLKLALLHDLPESRCGDVHYLSRQYVKRDETSAIRDMFAGTVHEKEMLALWREYEERKSKEARIVKDADNLDVEFEIQEYRAKWGTLTRYMRSNRNRQVYPRLYTKSAKRLWETISTSDPHDWHMASPKNRFKGGDWKEAQNSKRKIQNKK